ncbi:hypothetical protein MET9862_00591 [Methylobacterium symbioticum]|uniref:Uncharacterized protein n=1 Tax=Methylobacterium symbioticum TaxID=2584084 RepID=A0A509E796_9HYPH|nr:hypothetical protein MET9862_00591 [Methylobacterium symbioticum]
MGWLALHLTISACSFGLGYRLGQRMPEGWPRTTV